MVDHFATPSNPHNDNGFSEIPLHTYSNNDSLAQSYQSVNCMSTGCCRGCAARPAAMPKMKQSNNKSLKMGLHGLAFAVGFLTIVSVTSVICFTIFFMKQSTQEQLLNYIMQASSDSNNELCLPCDSLKRSYLNHVKFDMKDMKAGQCCVNLKNHLQLFILLKAFVKNITQEERGNVSQSPGNNTGSSKRSDRRILPAAELYYSGSSSERSSETLDQWSNNSIRGGVEVKGRRNITIPEYGRYAINYKVQYYLKAENLTERLDDRDQVTTTLVRYDGIQKHKSEKLRKTIKTRSVTHFHTKEVERDFIYESANVILYTNDWLVLEVSLNAIIPSDPESTYFSLRKLH